MVFSFVLPSLRISCCFFPIQTFRNGNGDQIKRNNCPFCLEGEEISETKKILGVDVIFHCSRIPFQISKFCFNHYYRKSNYKNKWQGIFVNVFRRNREWKKNPWCKSGACTKTLCCKCSPQFAIRAGGEPMLPVKGEAKQNWCWAKRRHDKLMKSPSTRSNFNLGSSQKHTQLHSTRHTCKPWIFL